MAGFFSEWAYLPDILAQIATSPSIWGLMLLGTVIGYIVGVIPGLGPTMGMALSLGIIFKLPPTEGLALLASIFVSAVGSGGVTAILANIPGTPASAATAIDGFALTKLGRGREAIGYSVVSSVIGTILGTLFIFIIQPFVTSIALKFGDWEVFLFCMFGLMICGSLSGDVPVKGWIAAMVGVLLAMVGTDGVQAVSRFTFGNRNLLTGFDSTTAMIGLFGLSEVFYVLREKESLQVVSEKGFPKVNIPVFIKNIPNIIKSALAGIWVGFIPGVGESAACWFSYDIAKRGSKHKEKFGKGSEEGIIAAETANNSCSIGALIPALALGIPGSSTVAIFLAAMYLMNYRPGPTLMIESPGILCEISVLFIIAALFLLVVAYFFSRFVIKFLSIPNSILMPIIAAFCVLGAYGTTYNMFSLVTLILFGLIGLFMKIYRYPTAPMILGLLVGNIADVNLRRALMQYAGDPIHLILRPFGLIVLVVLIALFILGIRTNKKGLEAGEENVKQFEENLEENK